MAKFNISITGKDPSAPTVDNSSANLSSATYIFKTADFTTNFTDIDGDSYGKVVLKRLPIVTQLKLLTENALVDSDFDASNASGLKLQLEDKYAVYNGVMYEFSKGLDLIIADYDVLGYKLTDNTNGTLTFTDLDNTSDIVTITGTVVSNDKLTLDFVIKEDTAFALESNVATFSLTPIGNINVKSVYVNNPPTIGDNSVSTYYTDTITFKQNDFIDDTDPKYSDPEGDQPYELKVLSLPAYGQLEFDSAAVSIDQIISFSDIVAGKFKYIPDNTRTDINDVTFRFAVSDTGSKTFVE
jgi:hypothetical protein